MGGEVGNERRRKWKTGEECRKAGKRKAKSGGGESENEVLRVRRMGAERWKNKEELTEEQGPLVTK